MLKLTFPFPDPGLNPNKSKGNHWGAISRLRKAQKNEWYWLAKAQPKPLANLPNYELKITFCKPADWRL